MDSHLTAVTMCEDMVVPADNADYDIPLMIPQGILCNLGVCHWAGFLVDLGVGAGAESVSFRVEGSLDPEGDWYTMTCHDLRAAALDKWNLAAAVTLTADVKAVLFAVSNPPPYVQVVVNNAGTNQAILTLSIVAQSGH
jgi:hypothetical protein